MQQPEERLGTGVPPGSGWGLTDTLGDFQDNSILVWTGIPSLQVWVSASGACRVLRYYFGTQSLYEHMSAQLHCWNRVRIKYTICFFFQNDIRYYSHIFSPFKFHVARCIASVAGNFYLSPKLKTSTELHSCCLHPWEQLPFKFPRWRLVACFAAQAGNEYELKGLYLRAVSLSFCLWGSFLSYITKFFHKIDISGKGQRQTGDYRSNWISATFHCKGQASAVVFSQLSLSWFPTRMKYLMCPGTFYTFIFILVFFVLIFPFLNAQWRKKVN